MQTVPLTRGFKTKQIDPETVGISGRGAGLGIGGMIFMAVMSLIISVPLGGAFSVFVLGQEGFLQLVIVLLTSTGIVFTVNRLKKPAYEFELRGDGIVKHGKLYKREDISEIFIDNRNAKGVELAAGSLLTTVGAPSSTHTGKPSITTGVATGLLLGAAKLGAKVNYRVIMRHGNRTIPLATSLDKNTALQLFDFLTEKINSGALLKSSR